MEKLGAAGEDFRLMLLPDHPTPLRIRTHSSDAVPYLIYDSTAPCDSELSYNEADAAAGGNVVPQGYKLLDKFLQLT